MSGEHRRAVRLPHGFTCTFVFRPKPYRFLEAFWEPKAPSDIRSPRAFRRLFRAYTADRNAFLGDVATMIGGSVLVADVGGDLGGVTVIEPETRH